MVAICSVDGCYVRDGLHEPPSRGRNPNVYGQWMLFLGLEDKEYVRSSIRVCNKHFTVDCFSNYMAVQMGFGKRLYLNPDAVPTLSHGGEAVLVSTREMGCQTDPPKTRDMSVSAWIPPTFRSKALQVHLRPATRSVSCEAVSLPSLPMFSTPTSPPEKRPHLECSIDDSTNVPDDSDPSLLENTVSDTPVDQMTKYIVYEDCLLELFQSCSFCRHACAVEQFCQGTLVSIKATCTHCSLVKRWKSQPHVGSIPAGDLHLSAAIAITGSSFAQTDKVLNALRVKGISESTYYSHQGQVFQNHCG
ncbi:hypothetical protein COCON_G00217510 [Conger conger]|uniref:THAP-type domain-containing protein n=1 Tax=Conger conger TaxID=82655 RepID=A0A9Q1HNR0_CONCO|nr:uncharacterized protein LOC133111679 [Conger conger]KAJ8252439.1 hypothetical protein COCON_G00217510 [Conger conger]